MKKFLVTEVWLLVLQAVVVSAVFLSIASCAPISAAGDVLLKPMPKDELLMVDLAKDKAEFQKILADPKASNFDKNAARYAIKGIEIAEKSNEGQSPLVEILAAVGVPGALVLGVLLKRVKARLELQEKATVQTVNGIEEFRNQNNGQLPEKLETSLDKARDADVKTVIAEIKSGVS